MGKMVAIKLHGDDVPAMYDVIEATLAEPHKIRVIASGKTHDDAEAIIKFAVIRRGVEAHFFAIVGAGKYQDGDSLQTPG